MRVGLFSPMGTGNLGDASTQDAVIHNLRKRIPNIEIYGFSLNPEDTTLRHGIPAFSISRFHWVEPFSGSNSASPIHSILQNNKFVRILRRLMLRIPQELFFTIKAFRQVRTLDVMIFSGSGQLADLWNKADRHCYSILRWTLLSRIVGIPVLFISVGAGPIKSALNRLFIKWALSLASYRSYRDAESRQFIADIGFDRSDPVLPDLAHSLPVVDKLPKNLSNSGNFVVGISPMAYAAPDLWFDQDIETYQTYLNKLAAFIKWLTDNRIKIEFFPSSVPPDDKVIMDLTDILRKKFGIILNEDQHPVQTVADLLSKIATVDIVVASRFHGILLPFVLHKPVIALSYHPKDISLMKGMGQMEYCLNIENFNVQSLIDCFLSLRQNIANVQSQIVEKEKEYAKLLAEQYEIVIALCSHK